MDKFVPKIKTKYKERRVIIEEQLPRYSSMLVKLDLVHREKLESYSANQQRGRGDRIAIRTRLAYSDLFKVKEESRPVRRVLVEGDAGIGKTTFTISISEDWANGKLFQDFELLLLIPLREKKVASVDSLLGLLKLLVPIASVCESVFEFMKEEEEKVLIIADGWDEVGESQQQEESFLYKLFFKDSHLMSVVVTSRPSASASLLRLSSIDRFVEINGFNKEDIKDFINSEFPSESDQEKSRYLLNQLEDNELIESVCTVPLNCTILCNLCRESKDTLPTTMTQLYTKIILNVICHNIQKKDAYKHIKNLPTFDDLPKELLQLWWILCKFAFEALRRDQLVFSKQDLQSFLPQGLDEKICCFGLLQISKPLFDTACGKSFHFIHLTFQEYLAGLHLARQLADQQSQVSAEQNLSVIIEEMLHSETELERFSVVWRFFFGTYFNVIGCNESHGIQPYISYYIEMRTFEELYKNVVLYHCAFEGNNVANTKAIIDAADNIGVIVDNLHTAHDCTAALYVIESMEEECTLEISFYNTGIREKQLTKLTGILASKGDRLQVKAITFDNNLPYESIFKFIRSTPKAFEDLTEVCFMDLYLGKDGVKSLVQAVNSDSLRALENFSMVGCLTSDADTNSQLLLALGNALSIHCPQLVSLQLPQNSLSVPGAKVLARFMSEYNKTCNVKYGISSIDLDETKLGDEGLCTFVKTLNTQILVYYLHLNNNSITSTGVSCLADAVISIKKIVLVSHTFPFHVRPGGLHLGNNPLGLEGALSIGKLVSSINFDGAKFYLDLSGCQLTTSCLNHNMIECENVEQQLHQLPQSNTAWYLGLDSNNFTGEGVHILIGFLRLCPQLCMLFTSNCEITSDNLNCILGSLVQFRDVSYSNLKYWDLRNNKIGDDGVDALIGHLSRLFLRDVDAEDLDRCGPNLDGNPVSPERMQRMTEAKMRHYKSSVSSSSEGEQLSETNSSISDEEQSGEISSVTSDREEASENSSSPSEEEQPISLVLSSSPGVINTHEEEQIQNPPTSESLCGGNRMTTSRSTDNYQSGGGEESSGSATSEESDTDLQPPPAKKQRWCDLPDVEPCHLALMEWKDENGASKKLKMYSKTAYKWNIIATLLGFELGEINSIRKNFPFDDYDRVVVVLRRWFDDAINLFNASKYPKSWIGLINLLNNAELGEVARELESALSSTHNSVRGNLQ